MPVGLLIVVPLLHLDTLPRRDAVAYLAVGIVGLLPAFNEGVFALGPLAVVAMVLSYPMLRRGWWEAWLPVAIGTAVGLVLVAPESIAFGATFVRSLSENSAAGWPLPHWGSIAEDLGLGDPYSTALAGGVPRSPLDLALDGVASAVSTGVIAGMLIRARRNPPTIVLASIVTVMIAIYLKTRYLDHASSYQYFKSIVILAAPAAAAIGSLIGTQFPHRARTVSAYTALVAGIVAASGIFYVVSFHSQGSVVPPAFSNLGTSQKVQSDFLKYNIVLPLPSVNPEATSQADSLEIEALGAEVDLNWLYRFSYVTTDLRGAVTRPVAILILENACPHWSCISRMGHRVVLEQDGVALVDIGLSSRGLASRPQAQWSSIVTNRYLSLGGRPS